MGGTSSRLQRDKIREMSCLERMGDPIKTTLGSLGRDSCVGSERYPDDDDDHGDYTMMTTTMMMMMSGDYCHRSLSQSHLYNGYLSFDH